MLEDLDIENTAIPLTTLTSFLLPNPYISSASISMPPGFIPLGARFPMLPEDYPRFLPRLRKFTATTDILLALFTPWPSASDRDIPLYNLESLTILKE
ncbi:hypothetical protein FA13DRAFT_230752 [Coprinellus micaceus]|uniref:Uncharacterized protein n=1 Tax=Coprinellus micaceus TaxID=71717 RepID=A0A4Y7TFD0_COPMI|nr:hypothetical protein FA13DRAFT_230752 [Coprinellus micaceus]